MARRRSSDLYQVDFVAALFGGFMLIWLSTMGPRTVTAQPSQVGSFFQIFAKAYFIRKDDNRLEWTSITPVSSVSSGCAHSNVVAMLAASGALVRPCSGPISLLRSPERKESEVYTEWTKSSDEKIYGKWPSGGYPILDVASSDFSVLIDDEGQMKAAPSLGLALSSIPPDERADYAFKDHSYVFVAVGMVPSGLDNGKIEIRLTNPDKFVSALLSVLYTDAAISGSLVPIAMRSYRATGINGPIRPTPAFKPEIARLVIQINISPGPRCLRAVFDLTNGVLADLTKTPQPC